MEPIFKENKFFRIYYRIIDKAKNSNRSKLKKNDTNYIYYEKHHIIPKCLGGLDTFDNIVLLTAREHFMCHFLLTKMNDSVKLVFILHRMMKSDVKNARLYELRRSEFANCISNFHKNRFIENPKLRQKVSEQSKGRKLSENHLAILRESNKTRVISLETRLKRSKIFKGRPNIKLKGRPFSEKHKLRLSEAKIGNGNANQKWEIVTPQGEVITISNRREFCIQNGLNLDSVKTVSQTNKLYKGYLFRKLKPIS